MAVQAGLPQSRQGSSHTVIPEALGSIHTIIPEGLGSNHTIIPEGLNSEPWSSVAAPLFPVKKLFPPREFQFHKTVQTPIAVGDCVTETMAGDDLPTEEHSLLPGFPRARPVTRGEFGRRSVWEAGSSPRSQGSHLDQQLQDQGQQLQHVRGMTLDLVSTVQELVEMQRKLGHELREVKLQAVQAQQEFRSSYAQISSLQRSGMQPPQLESSLPSYRSNGHMPTNSMVSSPGRTHMPQDFHRELSIRTPVLPQSKVSVARNLGYNSTQDLLDHVHGRALEGLGSLHDWTAEAMHNVIAGNGNGSNLCCQIDDRRAAPKHLKTRPHC